MTAEIEPRVQAYHPTLPKIELFARGKIRVAGPKRSGRSMARMRSDEPRRASPAVAEDRSVSAISEALNITKAKVIGAVWWARKAGDERFQPRPARPKVAQERDRSFRAGQQRRKSSNRLMRSSVILGHCRGRPSRQGRDYWSIWQWVDANSR